MAKDMPIHKEAIKPWRFYWHPPKNFYYRDDLDFWELEYAFVLDLKKKEYEVISCNAHEDFTESDVDTLPLAMDTNFFFVVDQSKVPARIYCQVMISIFESELLD